jgi:hypothetical protein
MSGVSFFIITKNYTRNQLFINFYKNFDVFLIQKLGFTRKKSAEEHAALAAMVGGDQYLLYAIACRFFA